MSNKDKLDYRMQCIMTGTWTINDTEKRQLDLFFRCQDNWPNLEKDLQWSEEDLCYYLEHDGKRWKVVLLQPYTRISIAKELGLSFRANHKAHFRVVLVKEWKQSATEAEIHG